MTVSDGIGQDTESFQVTVQDIDVSPPTADLSNPANNDSIDLSALNNRNYLVVAFFDAGSGVNSSTINGDELTLSGPGVGTAVLTSVTSQSGNSYRYNFNGNFVTGLVNVNMVSGTFQDLAGNTNAAETESFTVTSTVPPDLASIDNQTAMPGQTLTVPLSVMDPDTPAASLVYSVTVIGTTPLQDLDQQLNLNNPNAASGFLPYYQNYRGSQEKYLLNPNGTHPVNQWYYLMPNGDLFLFTGDEVSSAPSSLQGTFIRNLGVAVYTNPTLLHNPTPIATQFSGTVPNQLQITPPPGPVGYSFTVSVTVSDGIGQDTESFQVTVQSGPPDPGSDYDIDVNFIDNSLSSSQQAIFSQAAARWEQIITGDVPDVIVSGIGLVDDVVIEASGPFIDGPGNILGQAGPTAVRTGSFLPASGIMQFDSADLAALESAGQLFDVILHEMAHVLGLGTIWNALGLLVNPAPTGGGGDPRFVGASATAEYQTIFGVAESSVPAANTGGGGTLNAHWRESTFDNELMTGFLNSGFNPISRVTVGQFEDLGYVVNLNAADAYTRPILAQILSESVVGRLVVLDIPYQVLSLDGQLMNDLAANASTRDTFDFDAGSELTGSEDASQESPWQHQIGHEDVNSDGVVSALDVLQVVNDLNEYGARALGARSTSAPYLDVNGDFFVSTIDVLQIVNRLNAGSSTIAAEGESSPLLFHAATVKAEQPLEESDPVSPSEPNNSEVVSSEARIRAWWRTHERETQADRPEDDVLTRIIHESQGWPWSGSLPVGFWMTG